MIHLTQLKIGKTIRNNFKINITKEMASGYYRLPIANTEIPGCLKL
jgi:hypothetical protein